MIVKRQVCKSVHGSKMKRKIRFEVHTMVDMTQCILVQVSVESAAYIFKVPPKLLHTSITSHITSQKTAILKTKMLDFSSSKAEP